MLKDLTITDFVHELGSDSPAPGGGAVAAFSGAQAAALFNMVAALTVQNKKYAGVHEEIKALQPRLQEIENFYLEGIDRDANSFNGVMAAFKLPKSTPEEKEARSAKIQEEYKKAADVPLQNGLKVLDLLEFAPILAEKGNQNALTDVACGILQLRLCIRGAFYNVRINLSSIKDEVYVKETKKAMAKAEKKVDEATLPLLEELEGKLA